MLYLEGTDTLRYTRLGLPEQSRSAISLLIQGVFLLQSNTSPLFQGASRATLSYCSMFAGNSIYHDDGPTPTLRHCVLLPITAQLQRTKLRDIVAKIPSS